MNYPPKIANWKLLAGTIQYLVLERGGKEGPPPVKVLVSPSADVSNATSGDAAWTRDRTDPFWYANALVSAAGSVCRPKQHRQIWPILPATGTYLPVAGQN